MVFGSYASAPTLAFATTRFDADGGTAGGQIGYRWQTGQLVCGVEAQGNWADFKRPDVPEHGVRLTRTIRECALLVSSPADSAMPGSRPALRQGRCRLSPTSATASPLQQVRFGTGNNSDRSWGDTAGAGLEYGFSPNWSAGVEYDHLFMASARRDLHRAGLFGADRRPYRQDADIVTARINYRWGGPVVARY